MCITAEGAGRAEQFGTADLINRLLAGIAAGLCLVSVPTLARFFMDFTFNCPFCNQDLTIDESGVGSEIACPACREMLIVPTPAQARRPHSVPTTGTESLILKPTSRPLEATAKALKKIRLKTFRHVDCVKDDKDRFDEIVSDFLHKIGEDEVVSVQPIHYTQVKDGVALTDYGVVVVYKS